MYIFSLVFHDYFVLVIINHSQIVTGGYESLSRFLHVLFSTMISDKFPFYLIIPNLTIYLIYSNIFWMLNVFLFFHQIVVSKSFQICLTQIFCSYICFIFNAFALFYISIILCQLETHFFVIILYFRLVDLNQPEKEEFSVY